MYSSQEWYEYLDEPMQQLVSQAYYLADLEEMNQTELYDYSFVVFSMAKAYEGFLKKVLYDLGLISLTDYKGTFFRIGRSLNPDLPEKYRDDHWIYDDLQKLLCDKPRKEVEKMPAQMWQAWRLGRNALFHYFPSNQEFIDLAEARKRIDMIRDVMHDAYECKKHLQTTKIDSPLQEAQNIV